MPWYIAIYIEETDGRAGGKYVYGKVVNMAKAGKSKIKRNPRSTYAHLIGGGIASLTAAAYMIRDAGVPGKNINIYEYLNIDGGSLDGSGEAGTGYMIRGGRMLNLPTYECLQELFSSIPSLEFDSLSVTGEIIEYNEEFKTRARARIVNGDGSKADVTRMGFDGDDRIKMAKLIMESEESLGKTKISEYFGPHFFTTNFWYMWQTTFAFQPWSSAAELRRYMIRFMHEFPRIHTLEGVARTQFNQYDSLVLPIADWLKAQGVRIHHNVQVTDIRFTQSGGNRVVSEIQYRTGGGEKTIRVTPTDVVTFINGCMTDNSVESAANGAAELNRSENPPSFALWKKIAEGRPEFGRPGVFCGDVSASMWQSFTVTVNGNPALFDYMQRFTGNHAGGGALMTFRDSSWLMSTVVARQPHFKNQPLDAQIFWGYGLYPDKTGDYIKKPMLQCTGMEIVEELLYHMKAVNQREELTRNLLCRTCIMPYITSQFMPRVPGDRPLIIPEGYENFAFVGQFAEQPDDVVFTVEYSVRCAQKAVYYLLGVEKDLTPVHKHERDVKVLMDSFLKLHT